MNKLSGISTLEALFLAASISVLPLILIIAAILFQEGFSWK